MKAPRPCDRHNIWTDFDGGGPCARCGWSEKAIEVYLMEWAIDGHRPKPKLTLVSTSPKPEEP